VPDTLTQDFAEAFGRRRKAIGKKGRLEHDIRPSEGWAEVCVRSASGFRSIVRVYDGGVAEVYLQRVRQPRRGQTLARLDQLRIPVAGSRTVACLEATIQLAASTEAGVDQRDLQTALAAVWQSLAFDVV
jgi:hypothetical protein